MRKRSLKRFKEKEVRKQFAILFGGKMLGVASVLAAIKGFAWFFETAAGATPLQDVAVSTDQVVNAANTVWVLVTAFLVFFMQAGFMALEAGFARSREPVNALMSCVFDTCVCGLLYWAIGFAFQFGVGNGFIGHQYFFLHNTPATYGSTGVAFFAFFLFQFAFADTASTITTGAMVGRTSFKGDIIYSILVSGLIYPVFGHWDWGPGGWLATSMGWFSGFVNNNGGTIFFRDFAGSTVVHTVGGVIALAGCIVLGPRLGRKFKRDGGGPMPAHDIGLGAIGGVILWFGWYGFNPGSTLSAMDIEGIGRVATNTTLAACAAGIVAVAFVYPRSKKWDLGMAVNGFLGGLVAITCPCYWVSPFGAIMIGAVAGIVVPLGVDFMERRRWDDPIGAVPVHMMAGIWGTLSLGLFGAGKFGIPTPTGADNSNPVTGLFYGDHSLDQLKAQFVGSATCVILVGGFALLMFWVIRQLPGSYNLRLSKEGELEGLDIHEHGTPAYHMEFGYGMTYTTVTGSSGPGIDLGSKRESEAETVST
jgi:Amt family ammonium transporter